MNKEVGTCPECFAMVEIDQSQMHEKWHDHLDRMFDALASGKRIKYA